MLGRRPMTKVSQTEPMCREKSAGRRLLVANKCQEQVLGADVPMAQSIRLLRGAGEDCLCPLGERDFHMRRHWRVRIEVGDQLFANPVDRERLQP